MDVDEDDDFYAPEDSGQTGADEKPTIEEPSTPDVKADQEDEDLEEGEEEGEAEGSDDSDIDIITERKDGTTAPPPIQSRYNTIQNINERNVANNETAKPAVVKKESPPKAAPTTPGADFSGLAFSKIDVNAKPVYEPVGKPITQVNIDDDLTENDKPWRRPGTNVSDYFNYGFDEFTWALYASKQETLRSEFDADKIAQNSKKMFEDMNMMMAMGGGMPGMMPGAGAGAGMEGIPPEMQQMMQQMMSQGMDPSQMDPSMFGMGGNQTGAGGAGAAGQSGFGQGQNSQMGGYGFEQGMEGRSRGGNFGRGRGGRRNW